MGVRFRGGDWQPMLLGIEPRICKVCGKGLYRNFTFLRGGWSRCTICDAFVHYSCLASGVVKFLKQRPRVCKSCRAEHGQPRRQGERLGAPSVPSAEGAAEVGVGSGS